jgi:hypothetical protein
VVESEEFVKGTNKMSGFKAKAREVIGGNGNYELKESPAPYKGNLVLENEPIRLQNR